MCFESSDDTGMKVLCNTTIRRYTDTDQCIQEQLNNYHSLRIHSVRLGFLL
jgi:hypothetical protein